MLVISRKLDERIWIGGNVFITIAQISGDKVRIGIEAPKEIPVYRQEVAHAILIQGKTIPCLTTEK